MVACGVSNVFRTRTICQKCIFWWRGTFKRRPHLSFAFQEAKFSVGVWRVPSDSLKMKKKDGLASFSFFVKERKKKKVFNFHSLFFVDEWIEDAAAAAVWMDKGSEWLFVFCSSRCWSGGCCCCWYCCRKKMLVMIENQFIANPFQSVEIKVTKCTRINYPVLFFH